MKWCRARRGAATHPVARAVAADQRQGRGSSLVEVEATGELYDTDMAAWAGEQASLLRAKRWDDIDVERVAEEIEDVAKSERRELKSRLVILLAHLARWRAQPRHRRPSWESTIVQQRVQIESVLDDSPSLRPTLPELVTTMWPRAVLVAAKESGLQADVFPARCSWSVDQVLDSDFLPD